MPCLGSAQRLHQHDDHRRNALGRRALQQRRVSAQGHALRRKLRARRHAADDSNDSVPAPTPEETRTKGILPEITPLERWEISQPGNVLRVFERGGGPKGEVGEPVRADDAAKPDDKLSTRGFGTLLRTDPVFPRSAENAPARSAAFAAGHERSAGRLSRQRMHGLPRRLCERPLARTFRAVRAIRQSRLQRDERSDDSAKSESGHPIRHEFTRSIPSSQCMVCHIHPGTNMVTTYFGYTWWDNESDGDAMYPKEQHNPTEDERIRSVAAQSGRRGGARAVVATRNFWQQTGSAEIQRKTEEHAVRRFSQPRLALPRGVHARPARPPARRRQEASVPPDDPKKFEKAVAPRGHSLAKGNAVRGLPLSSRTATAPENFTASRAPQLKSTASIATARFRQRATLITSGPAAPGGGTHLEALRTPWRERQFEWREGKLYPALHDGPGPGMGSGADARLDHARAMRTTARNRAWRKRCARTA